MLGIIAALLIGQVQVDASTIGVKPGTEDATRIQNRKILYDYWAKNGPGSVKFPFKTFVDWPLRPPGGTEIWGNGARWSSIESQYAGWTLLLNLDLNPLNPNQTARTPLTADHWVDLTNDVLDSTAGQRRGWRSRGNTFLVLPASPFTHPQGGWESLDRFTIQTVVKFHEPAARRVDLISIKRDQNTTSPINLMIDGNDFRFAFRTSEGLERNFRFPCPKWPCTATLDIDIDLLNDKIIVVENGQLQKPVVLPAWMGADWGQGKHKIKQNKDADLTIGIGYMGDAEWYAINPTQIVDFTLGSYRFGSKALLNPDGTRIDGKPFAHYQHFDEGNGCIQLIGNYASIEDMTQTGLLPTRPSNGVAICLQPNNANTGNSSSGDSLHDIAINGGYAIPGADPGWGWGGAVGLGPMIDYRQSNTKIIGGGMGQKSFFPTATYLSVYKDNSFSAKLYPLWLWTNMISIRDTKIASNGRTSMKFFQCGFVNLDTCFVSGFGDPDVAVELESSYDSSVWIIKGLVIDNEYGDSLDCLIRATPSAGQNGTTLSVDGSLAATMSKQGALIDLVSLNLPPPWKVPQATVSVRNSQIQVGPGPLVRNSKQWSGTVQLQDKFDYGGPPIIGDAVVRFRLA
jgi:hypothetical protein